MAANPSIGRARNVEQPLRAPKPGAASGLCDRHHRRVYAFCLAQLRNADEAADAAQTTFVHALAALQRGTQPTFELGWLLVIARNVCRARWDARRRRRHLEVVTDPQDLAELAHTREPSDRLDGVDDALARLPELQRRAVVLRDWQGLSYKEIAGELDVTLAAAETLIFRGRSALARELGADETPQSRLRLGLGSLLVLFKPAALGGGSAVKLALGAAAVVAVGAAGTRELVRPAVTHSEPPVAAAVVASSAGVVAAGPLSADAPVARLTAAHDLPARPGRVPRAAARPAAKPIPQLVRRPRPASARPIGAANPPPQRPRAAPPPSPADPHPPPAASPAPATDAPPASPPAARPQVPVVAPTAPRFAPATPLPIETVTGAATPVGTTATATVQPVVTTATATVQPVVTTVAATVQPAVTAVTEPAEPVVTTASGAVAPVLPAASNALPPLPSPPPLQLP